MVLSLLAFLISHLEQMWENGFQIKHVVSVKPSSCPIFVFSSSHCETYPAICSTAWAVLFRSPTCSDTTEITAEILRTFILQNLKSFSERKAELVREKGGKSDFYSLLFSMFSSCSATNQFTNTSIKKSHSQWILTPSNHWNQKQNQLSEAYILFWHVSAYFL